MPSHLNVDLDDPNTEISVSVAVVLSGISENTIRKPITSGELPARRSEDRHGKLFIRVGDFDDWLARRAAKAAQNLSPAQRKRLAELLMKQPA